MEKRILTVFIALLTRAPLTLLPVASSEEAVVLPQMEEIVKKLKTQWEAMRKYRNPGLSGYSN